MIAKIACFFSSVTETETSDIPSDAQLFLHVSTRRQNLVFIYRQLNSVCFWQKLRAVTGRPIKARSRKQKQKSKRTLWVEGDFSPKYDNRWCAPVPLIIGN